MKHSCSNRDECDRRFVLDHVEWLVEQNQTKLEGMVMPLVAKKGIPASKLVVRLFMLCEKSSWQLVMITLR